MFSIVNPSRPSPTKHNFANSVFLFLFFMLFVCCFVIISIILCFSVIVRRFVFPHFLCMCFLLVCVCVFRFSYTADVSHHTISNMCTMLYFRFDICLFKMFAYVVFVFSCIYVFLCVLGCYVARSIVVFMFVFLLCPCCRSSLFVSFTVLRVFLLLICFYVFV